VSEKEDVPIETENPKEMNIETIIETMSLEERMKMILMLSSRAEQK
jgi:hypothetical protein